MSAYSKKYRTTIKGKLRKALEFCAHDNEMKESEVLRDALKLYLEVKGFLQKPKPTTQQP